MSIDLKNIIDFMNKIQILEDTVNSMNMKLGTLQNEIKHIKSKEDSQKPELPCENVYYQTSSNTVLKHHMSTKHKHTTSTTEEEKNFNI